MSSAASETLLTANANLRAGLARLSQPSNPSAPLGPKDLSGLLAELLRAGACVRSMPPCSVLDAEFENAISEYRSTLEQLALILPHVHGRLLTEKVRLEMARQHVRATAAWAQASRETL